MSRTMQLREIVEAYCYECSYIWRGEGTSEQGRWHASETGHRVRVVETTITMYNEAGDDDSREQKVTDA